MNTKRVTVCTILGALAGVVCFWVAKNSGVPGMMGERMMLGIILNRALIGFVIGISGWKKINIYLHGAVIGVIVSALMAVYADVQGATMILVAGAVWGVLIEFVATNLLKIKAK